MGRLEGRQLQGVKGTRPPSHHGRGTPLRVGCSAKVTAGVTVPFIQGCLGLCPVDSGLSAAGHRDLVTGSGAHRCEVLNLQEIRSKR